MKKQCEEESEINQSEIKDVLDTLIPEIVERYQEIQRLAKMHGIFLDDRELLDCSKCGLKEDVTFDGRLIVTNLDGSILPELSFITADKAGEWFKCPMCREKIKINLSQDNLMI